MEKAMKKGERGITYTPAAFFESQVYQDWTSSGTEKENRFHELIPLYSFPLPKYALQKGNMFGF